MTAKPKKKELPIPKVIPFKSPEVLDVKLTAQFLTVSADTIYTMFQKGELPGRKVGRKWITTKAAVLRWVESSLTNDTLGRAIECGDSEALKEAINSGKVKIKTS